MKLRFLAAAILLVFAGAVCALSVGVLTGGPLAEGAAVRVLASNGVQGALNELIPQCERATGHPLTVEFDTTASIKPKIEGGAAFDFTVLTADAVDALIADGKVAASSRTGVARVGIGVGIRAGAAKPDVSTPEALKKTLLNAKSITYAAAGASRPAIDKMLRQMGIADALQSKTLLLPGAAETTAAVANGKAELLLTLVSEIVSAKGLALAGLLPAAFQTYIAFSAGVSANAKNGDAARAAIQFLTGPKTASVYQAKGMEPLR